MQVIIAQLVCFLFFYMHDLSQCKPIRYVFNANIHIVCNSNLFVES